MACPFCDNTFSFEDDFHLEGCLKLAQKITGKNFKKKKKNKPFIPLDVWYNVLMMIQELESFQTITQLSKRHQNLFNYDDLVGNLKIRIKINEEFSPINQMKQLEQKLAKIKYSNIDLRGTSIGYGKLKAMSRALRVNNGVRFLNFGGNHFDLGSMKVLAKIISESKSLEVIDLSCCGRVNEYGLFFLSNALYKNTKIRKIHFEGNQINATDMRSFSTMLNFNKSIKYLYLQDNELSNEGLNYLSAPLESNRTLVELDISGNRITAEGMKNFQSALKENKSLRRLNLENNKLGTKGLKYLSKGLIDSSITHLNLQGTLHRSQVWELKDFAPMLKMNTSIQVLDISNNGIRNTGLLFFCECIKSNKMLKSLSLDGNMITDVGAFHISELLETNNTLVNLDLGDNRITCGGVKRIFIGLKNNRTLKSINFYHNEIGDEGIKELVDLLFMNCNNSVENINLRTNKVTDVGAKYIQKHLGEMKNIKSFCLFGNEVGGDLINEIEEILGNG